MDDLKQGLLIPIEDFLNPTSAIQSIAFAWENRHRVAKTIQLRLT